MVRIGLIGCGIISNAHINAVREIPEAEITAVCDISEVNLQRAVNETGAAAFTDYKKMITEAALDFVVINLPHALHNPCTCFCAEHKVNILLEKPMGISESDCQEMIDACEKNNVLLWIGHLQRYQPENIAAKQLIDSGKYGKLTGFYETRNSFYFSDNRPRWFLDKKMSGGGIMMNLGAHSLDKLKYFTGSEIETAVGHADILEGNTVESSVQAFVKTKSGVGATINLIGYTSANRYETVLYLTEGEIRIILGSGVSACGKDGVFENVPVTDQGAVKLQMIDVIHALSTKEAKVGGEYGKDIIKAIGMIYNS